MRERFLEGLDDIGITLRTEDAITDFEATAAAWLPSAVAPVRGRAARRRTATLEQLVELVAADLLGQRDEVLGGGRAVAVLVDPGAQDLEEGVVAHLLAERLQRHPAADVHGAR